MSTDPQFAQKSTATPSPSKKKNKVHRVIVGNVTVKVYEKLNRGKTRYEFRYQGADGKQEAFSRVNLDVVKDEARRVATALSSGEHQRQAHSCAKKLAG